MMQRVGWPALGRPRLPRWVAWCHAPDRAVRGHRLYGRADRARNGRERGAPGAGGPRQGPAGRGCRPDLTGSRRGAVGDGRRRGGRAWAAAGPAGAWRRAGVDGGAVLEGWPAGRGSGRGRGRDLSGFQRRTTVHPGGIRRVRPARGTNRSGAADCVRLRLRARKPGGGSCAGGGRARRRPSAGRLFRARGHPPGR